MAKITTEQGRNLTNKSSSGYFNLKNDGDMARVKFMYDKVSDVETYAVHEVEINGFNRHVDCLKDAEGNGTCPFCDKGFRRVARTFFKLYNADKDTVEVWDCGIKRAPLIENLLKMSQSEKLVNNCYEIIRHGKPKSTDTTYELIFKGTDSTVLTDLPEAPEIYGRYVLKKTAEEMEYFITHNEFPKPQKTENINQPATDGVKKRDRMAF